MNEHGLPPPTPSLQVTRQKQGIILSWDMIMDLNQHHPIHYYQIYTCKDFPDSNIVTPWQQIGKVKALPLPMHVTLKDFSSGARYNFKVQAVDICSRHGIFSQPKSIIIA